jgi:hypothetical protein
MFVKAIFYQLFIACVYINLEKVPSFEGKTDETSSYLSYRGIGDLSPLWNELELVT